MKKHGFQRFVKVEKSYDKQTLGIEIGTRPSDTKKMYIWAARMALVIYRNELDKKPAYISEISDFLKEWSTEDGYTTSYDDLQEFWTALEQCLPFDAELNIDRETLDDKIMEKAFLSAVWSKKFPESEYSKPYVESQQKKDPLLPTKSTTPEKQIDASLRGDIIDYLFNRLDVHHKGFNTIHISEVGDAINKFHLQSYQTEELYDVIAEFFLDSAQEVRIQVDDNIINLDTCIRGYIRYLKSRGYKRPEICARFQDMIIFNESFISPFTIMQEILRCVIDEKLYPAETQDYASRLVFLSHMLNLVGKYNESINRFEIPLSALQYMDKFLSGDIPWEGLIRTINTIHPMFIIVLDEKNISLANAAPILGKLLKPIYDIISMDKGARQDPLSYFDVPSTRKNISRYIEKWKNDCQ